MSAVVYRAYDKALTLIYVGSTVDFRARVAEHLRQSPWARAKTYWLTTEYGDLDEARRAEREAIREEHSEANKVGRTPGDPAFLYERPKSPALITTRQDARDLRIRRAIAEQYARVLTPLSAARAANREIPNDVLDARRSRTS